jgi:hypothetical protein
MDVEALAAMWARRGRNRPSRMSGPGGVTRRVTGVSDLMGTDERK